MNKSTKTFVYVTLLAAMAITINMFETMFVAGLPLGIRFGFANVIALITIELFSYKEMMIVNGMRVVLGNLLRGALFGTSFWISLSGVVLSSIVLMICKKLKKTSFISTAMLCSIAHSVGQVFMVMIFYKTTSMAFVIPLLLVTSIPTGIITGLISAQALPRIRSNLKI